MPSSALTAPRPGPTVPAAPPSAAAAPAAVVEGWGTEAPRHPALPGIRAFAGVDIRRNDGLLMPNWLVVLASPTAGTSRLDAVQFTAAIVSVAIDAGHLALDLGSVATSLGLQALSTALGSLKWHLDVRPPAATPFYRRESLAGLPPGFTAVLADAPGLDTAAFRGVLEALFAPGQDPRQPSGAPLKLAQVRGLSVLWIFQTYVVRNGTEIVGAVDWVARQRADVTTRLSADGKRIEVTVAPGAVAYEIAPPLGLFPTKALDPQVRPALLALFPASPLP